MALEDIASTWNKHKFLRLTVLEKTEGWSRNEDDDWRKDIKLPKNKRVSTKTLKRWTGSDNFYDADLRDYIHDILKKGRNAINRFHPNLVEPFRIKELFLDYVSYLFTYDGFNELVRNFNITTNAKTTTNNIVALLDNPKITNKIDSLCYKWLIRKHGDRPHDLNGPYERLSGAFETINKLRILEEKIGLKNPFKKEFLELNQKNILELANFEAIIERLKRLRPKEHDRLYEKVTLEFKIGKEKLVVNMPEDLTSATRRIIERDGSYWTQAKAPARKLMEATLKILKFAVDEVWESDNTLTQTHNILKKYFGYVDFYCGLTSRHLYNKTILPDMPLTIPKKTSQKGFPIEGKKVFHPLALEETIFNQPFIPNNILPKTNQLVITGPNNAGKSVYSRLLSNLIPAKMGDLIPARSFIYNPKTKIHFPFPKKDNETNTGDFVESLIQGDTYFKENKIRKEDIVLIEDLGGKALADTYAEFFYKFLEANTIGFSTMIILHNNSFLNMFKEHSIEGVTIMKSRYKNNQPTFKISDGLPNMKEYINQGSKLITNNFDFNRF
jgi:hypothetical protein